VRGSALSNDGKWFAFVQGPNEGNATMVLRSTAAGGRADTINVGSGGGSPQMSGDSKWLGYFVAPPRSAAGGARGGPGAAGGRGGPGGAARGGQGGAEAPGAAAAAGAQANDSAVTANTLVLRNLATGETKEFRNIRRFGFNTENATWVWMQGGGGPAGGAAPAAGGGGRGGAGLLGGGGGGAQAGGSTPVILFNLQTGEMPNIGVVNQFAFNRTGSLLAYTMDNADQVGNAVQVRDLATGVTRALESEQVLYRHLQWVDSSRAVAVMRGKVATSGAVRDTLFSVAVFRGVSASGATGTVQFSPAGRSDFPTGWKLASDRAPRWSADLSQVFFGIREGAKPPSPAGRGNSMVQAGAPGMGAPSTRRPRAAGAGRVTHCRR
jgi:hypothetical protein